MGTRVYVGNLPIDIKEREIDDLFYKYGRIRDIDLKTPSRPPAFAFVVFEDSRDAEDAIQGRDGYQFDGCRLRVEIAKGERGFRGGSDRSFGGISARGGGNSGGGGRRTDYGVLVTNLPRSCSWQDLKDYMRKAGDVVYTDVDHRGEGIVEYSNRDDMERAVDRLDDTEFKNPFDSSFIRVRHANKRSKDRESRDRDRKRYSRSVSRSKSRSKSRSRSRDRRGSRKLSRSPDSPRRGGGSDDEKDKVSRSRDYREDSSEKNGKGAASGSEDRDKEDGRKVKDTDSNDGAESS